MKKNMSKNMSKNMRKKKTAAALLASLVPFLAASLLCASGPAAAKDRDFRLVCVDECRHSCAGSPRRQLYCQDTCVRRCLAKEPAPRIAAPHF
jgi:hypothetical protein